MTEKTMQHAVIGTGLEPAITANITLRELLEKLVEAKKVAPQVQAPSVVPVKAVKLHPEAPVAEVKAVVSCMWRYLLEDGAGYHDGGYFVAESTARTGSGKYRHRYKAPLTASDIATRLLNDGIKVSPTRVRGIILGLKLVEGKRYPSNKAQLWVDGGKYRPVWFTITRLEQVLATYVPGYVPGQLLETMRKNLVSGILNT